MRRVRHKLAAAGACALAAGALVGGGWRLRALAEVPTIEPLFYAGTLTQNGQAVTGVKGVVLTFWNHASSVAPAGKKCDMIANTQVTAGRFRIALKDECVQAVRATPDLWIEAAVDGTSLGRKKVGAVPFALEAQRATTAVTAATATTATSASGALKTTIDQLAGRKTRALRESDARPGCPGAGTPAGTDLIVLSFVLTKETPVRLSGDMIRYADGRADLLLMVNDKEGFIAVTHTTGLAWAAAHAEWVGDLPAGTHKISLRGRPGFGGDNIWGCGVHGSLSALLFE